MVATPRSGVNGLLMIDTTSGGDTNAVTVTGMASWTFDQSRDFFDTTSCGDTSKNGVPGFPNANGTITGPWDSSDNNRYTILGATSERTMKLYPDVTNNPTTYIYGKAFFSGTFSGGVTDAVKADLTFTAGPTGLQWAHP